MSEHQHTPGPWEVQESGSGMLSSTFITHWRGDIIASMMGPSRDNYDARLIAAAPEMLEVLNKIVALSDGFDSEGSTGPKEPLSWESVGRLAIDLSRAAIAKATGKEVQP